MAWRLSDPTVRRSLLHGRGCLRGSWGWAVACLCCGPLFACACAPKGTRFELLDFSAPGEPVGFFEEFTECYYARNPDGTVDVVARRRGSLGDEGASTTQVIHLRAIWPAVPGTTAVESSQVNATVSYWIVSADGGLALEGGGFLFVKEKEREGRLTGALESSALQPVRTTGRPPSLFERVELTGKLNARRDRLRVTRLVNDMKREFGPLPRYEAPPPGPL